MKNSLNNCYKFCQVLAVASSAVGDERDLIRKILKHAKTCDHCKRFIKKMGFVGVSDQLNYLEKTWKELDEYRAKHNPVGKLFEKVRKTENAKPNA